MNVMVGRIHDQINSTFAVRRLGLRISTGTNEGKDHLVIFMLIQGAPIAKKVQRVPTILKIAWRGISRIRVCSILKTISHIL